MRSQEFKKDMKRLIERFSKSHSNAYPSAVQKIIWHYVESISGKEWEDIVNKLMAYNTFPPMLDKIKAFVDPILERIARETKKRQSEEAQRAMDNLKGTPVKGETISKFVKDFEFGRI